MLARFVPTKRTQNRRGVAAVEAGLVLVVFFLFLFGIFEYGRFLWVLHLTNNAARDGVRYASVNVNKPSDFNNTDFTDAGGTVYPSIERYTQERLGGAFQNLDGCRIAVFAVDADGLQLNPIVVRPKTSSPGNYPDPFDPNDPYAVPWNSVPFPDRLAVSIEGTYHPIVPSFLSMSADMPVVVTAMSGGEG